MVINHESKNSMWMTILISEIIAVDCSVLTPNVRREQWEKFDGGPGQEVKLGQPAVWVFLFKEFLKKKIGHLLGKYA